MKQQSRPSRVNSNHNLIYPSKISFDGKGRSKDFGGGVMQEEAAYICALGCREGTEQPGTEVGGQFAHAELCASPS